MTEQKAPAGWYDDPAGSGGKRFWSGRSWTERVEGGAQGAPPGRVEGTPRRASTQQGRIPDGYMLLNGKQVPIRGKLPQEPGGSRIGSNGALLVGVLVALGVVRLLGLV